MSWQQLELRCKRSFCLVLVSALAACQTAGTARGPRIAFDAEPNLGTVAFVALPVQPEVELKGFVAGKGSGALGAAGSTFMGCLGTGGSHGGCSGGGSLGAAVCGAAVLLWLGVCTVATGASAIVGAGLADSATSVQANVTTISANLDGAKIQQGLRDQVVKAAAEAGSVPIATVSADEVARAAAAKNYAALAAAGIDNVFQISVTKIGTIGTGFDPPLTLYMLAQVHIVNTRDNSQRVVSNHSYMSEQHLLREWSADQGALLQRVLESGFATLGASIADHLLRGYSFPSRELQDKESIGLAAVYPKTTTASRLGHLEQEANWNKIDSLQPVLQWQSFPREADRTAAPEAMAGVRDVLYDLVVAEEVGLGVGPIVASVYGIRETRYRVASPLKPGKRYFWTVRASFELDGRRRVTPWAIASSGLAAVTFKLLSAHVLRQTDALLALAQPSPASYRFQTGLAPGNSTEAPIIRWGHTMRWGQVFNCASSRI